MRRSDGNGTDTYTYDFENCLVEADVQLGPEPGRVVFTYDADQVAAQQRIGANQGQRLADPGEPFLRIGDLYQMTLVAHQAG